MSACFWHTPDMDTLEKGIVLIVPDGPNLTVGAYVLPSDPDSPIVRVPLAGEDEEGDVCAIDTVFNVSRATFFGSYAVPGVLLMPSPDPVPSPEHTQEFLEAREEPTQAARRFIVTKPGSPGHYLPVTADRVSRLDEPGGSIGCIYFSGWDSGTDSACWFSLRIDPPELRVGGGMVVLLSEHGGILNAGDDGED